MEKENLKKEIIIELIIDKLFRCLEVEDGIINFEKYNINREDMQFLLKKYDEEKYNAYCEMLLNKKED